MTRRGELSVRDVMTTDVLVLAPEITLRDAVEALVARHVSGAPVMSGDRVVGTLSAGDILAFTAVTSGCPTEREETDTLYEEEPDWDDESLPPAAYFTELWEDAGANVAERFQVSDSPEWDVLAEHTVGEAMQTNVIAVPPAAPVRIVAERIDREGVHRALVLEEGKLVGIVTTMDITRAVAHAPMNGKANGNGTQHRSQLLS